MEKFRPLKLKNLFFYILYSWRTIIICLLLCILIASAFTLLSSILISNTNDIDPKILLDDEEMEKAKTDFLSEDIEAKSKLDEIQQLEKEMVSFQKKLDNDYYLKIDPSNRMNKSFTLNLELVDTGVMDETSASRIKRDLSNRYLQALSEDDYLRFVASNSLLGFNEENIRNLYSFAFDSDGLVHGIITGPSELVIDQIIQKTKDYIEKKVHTNLDLLHNHNIIFENNKSEIVKDREIPLIIQELNSKIFEREQRIEDLNAKLEEDFILSLKAPEENILDLEINTGQSSARSYVPDVKKIVLAMIFGLLLSFIIVLIKSWKYIRGLDIFFIAKQSQVPYLGILYYKREIDRKGISKFGQSIDKLLVRAFDMEYSEQHISVVASSLAQMLNSKVDDNSSPGSVRLLMPRADTDSFFIKFLEKLQRELDALSNLMGSHIFVQAIGDISDDSEAIRALISSEGLILLWNRTSNLEDLILEKQQADNLGKKIWGVLELQEKY